MTISIAPPSPTLQSSPLAALLARRLHVPPTLISAGREIVSAGTAHTQCAVLLTGWAIRTRGLSDGGQQILSFVLPGDLVCLGAPFYREASQSVRSLTPLQVVSYPASAVAHWAEGDAALMKELACIYLREGSIGSERLVSLGLRSAYDRVLHFLLELRWRLAHVGLARDNEYLAPITQQMLGETLGLSSIHINRTIQRIKGDGLMMIGNRQPLSVTIVDLERASERCGFDSGYLRFDRPSR